MGIGQKLKETFSGDQSDRKHYNDSSTPGSFPSDGDGTQYHPPTGTAVGGHGTSATHGHAEDGLTGGYGASGHKTMGHGIGSAERRVDDRHVMDPADTKIGSNVMDSTGVAGNPVSSSSTGDHHNKLHKREDPRRYEDSATGAGVGTGTGGLGSGEIPERRHHAGRDTEDYGRGTTGLGRDTSSSYDNDPRSASSTTDRGHGVYNTVTGTGSHEDHTQSHHHQGHHDRKPVPGTTGTGFDNREHQGHGTVQHARDAMDPRTTGTGTGAHHGHHEGRHHGGDTFDSRNTGTGVGSQDMAYRPHDTTSTGALSDRREHIGPSDDSRGLGDSHGRSGLAGAGVGAGAAGIAAHAAGKHHDGQHGQHGDTGRSTYDSTGNTPGQRSYDIGHNNTTGATGDYGTSGGNYNDPSRTTGSAGQGHDQGYNQGHGLSQGHHGGAQDRAVDSIRSHQQHERGVNAPVGSDTVAGHTPGSHLGQSGVGSGLSSGQQRTPHDGAKVLHQCEHCGRDNDISAYFKKEVVYRLGQ